MIKNIFFWSLIGAFTFSGCVDTEFDEPENTLMIDQDKVVTIESILEQYDPNNPIQFEDDIYISGQVTADDESGNFFKTIVFQDGTGALSIIPDRNELNAEFPIGRKIYIKLQGLYLASDSGTPRLGFDYSGGDLLRIPDALVNEFMISAADEDTIYSPEEATIEDVLQNSTYYLNRLVELKNIELTDEFAGLSYANSNGPNGPVSENREIQDCDGNTLILRNSGFADFADELMPLQNGNMTGIISQFGNDLQIFIRNLNDVNLTENRCDGSGGGPAGNEITIQSLQDAYYQSGVDKAPEGFISGIVVSDRSTGQLNGQNIILQNGDYGVVVRFSSQHSFDLGTELEITVTGRELSEFRNQFQVNGVPLSNAIVKSTNASLPAPMPLTVAEILNNNNRYESTRVQINGVSLSGGETWGVGNIVVDDGTGTLVIFTFSSTSYANDEVPCGDNIQVVGILSQYEETVQVMLNDPNEEVTNGVDCNGSGGGDEFFEDFESGSDFEDINYSGWLNVATVGDRRWIKRSFDENGFAEIRAFQEQSPTIEGYLITPSINLDEISVLSFESAMAFFEHDGLEILVSPDFDNLDDAEWKSVDADLAGNSNGNYDWVQSGDINLTDYESGMVRIGFKYTGTSAQNTTTFRIDNVRVR